MTSSEVAQMTLIRPFSMTFTEPIILAIDLYIGLIYAILYSYFESYPIVYAMGYGWKLGVSNLPFASLLVGAVIAYGGYCLWNWWVDGTSHFPRGSVDLTFMLVGFTSRQSSRSMMGKYSQRHGCRCPWSLRSASPYVPRLMHLAYGPTDLPA